MRAWFTPALPEPLAQGGVDLRLSPEGCLLSVGPGWQALTGMAASDCLGRPLTDCCPPDARQACTALLRRSLQPQPPGQALELPLQRGDGSGLWLALRLRACADLAEGYMANAVDITLRVQEARLRRICDSALQEALSSVVICDAMQPGLPIVYVNAEFERSTGYSAHEALGRSCSFLQGDQRDQAPLLPLRQALRRGEPVRVELLNFRKNGEPFWNQLEVMPLRDPRTSAVTHFLGRQGDVTPLVEARRAEQTRVAQLDQVFRHMPVGTLAVHEDGRVGVVSAAFEGLTGLRAADCLGRPLSDLWSALIAACDPAQPPVPLPRAGEHGVLALQRPVARRVEVTVSEPEAAGLDRLLFFRDVTTELELRRMKTRFLAHAAHEMRAPMGAIRGFAELLLMREHPPQQAREMMETVHRQAMRLNTLLSDLLELSKIEALGAEAMPLTPVSLDEVLRHALDLMRLPNDARPWQIRGADAGLMVQAHAGKLEQVLINLLSNAIKYSPASGLIEVTAALLSAPQTGWCCVSIRDEGIGMNAEQLGQLFTHFFRVDPNGPVPGTGLGLVIVKELLERMGGRIEVQSSLGAGTTFRVLLRLAEPACGAHHD